MPTLGDLIKGNRDVLPDHASSDGDPVAMEFKIRMHKSGALSVIGPIEDKAFALAVLENAKDAVNNYHTRKSMLIVPGKDVSIPTKERIG